MRSDKVRIPKYKRPRQQLAYQPSPPPGGTISEPYNLLSIDCNLIDLSKSALVKLIQPTEMSVRDKSNMGGMFCFPIRLNDIHSSYLVH